MTNFISHYFSPFNMPPSLTRFGRRGLVFFLVSLLLHTLLLQSLSHSSDKAAPLIPQDTTVQVTLNVIEPAAPITAPAPVTPAAPPPVIATNSTTQDEATASQQANPAVIQNKTPIDENTLTTEVYRVSAPPPVVINMQLRRTDANHVVTNGITNIDWSVVNGHYNLEVEAQIERDNGLANLYTYKSIGVVAGQGILPELSSITRHNRTETAIHFSQIDQQLTFSSANKTEVLQAGGQDKASLLIQLAGIGAADPQLFATGKILTIQVAEDRTSALFQLAVLGQEQLDTPLGQLTTWHLKRIVAPQSPLATLEIWLAPEQHWYPVQLRTSELNGTVTTQTITHITVKPE